MNIVIVGFGGMGKTHFYNIKKFNSANFDCKLTVTGVYDIDKSLNQAVETYGLKFYNSFNDVLSDKAVDSILIATPNDSHLEYAVNAAKFKKHIICEKPIAMTLNEAKMMYNVAKENKVLLFVHQNRRWDGDFLLVKNVIESGIIGQPCIIESSVTGSNGLPGSWRKLIKNGGGMMLDWGVHLIDQICLLNLAKLSSIYCDYSYFYNEEVEDGFRLMLKYDSGVKVIITVDTNSFKQLSRWRVLGSNGSLEVEDWQQNGGITVVNNRVDDNLKGIMAGTGYTRTMGIRSDSTIKNLPLEKVESNTDSFYQNFCKSCAGKEEPLIKSEQVLNVFDIMEKAKQSALNNMVIKI